MLSEAGKTLVFNKLGSQIIILFTYNDCSNYYNIYHSKFAESENISFIKTTKILHFFNNIFNNFKQ